MLFSGGACSRRVSLSLKPFSFPRRCAKLERERERVGSWERAGEFCRRCFVLCGMPREGGEGKKDFKVFLGNEEKERILMSEMFLLICFFFSIFFFSRPRTTNGIRDDNHSQTKYHLQRDLFRYFRGEKHLFAKLPDYIR